MPDKIIGVTVGGGQVQVVLLTHDGPDAFTLEDETTLNLQKGDRPAAYSVLHGQSTITCSSMVQYASV